MHLDLKYLHLLIGHSLQPHVYVVYSELHVYFYMFLLLFSYHTNYNPLSTFPSNIAMAINILLNSKLNYKDLHTLFISNMWYLHIFPDCIKSAAVKVWPHEQVLKNWPDILVYWDYTQLICKCKSWLFLMSLCVGKFWIFSNKFQVISINYISCWFLCTISHIENIFNFEALCEPHGKYEK